MWRKVIPWSMVAGRGVVLAPALVATAKLVHAPEAWFGAIIVAGFVSDVFDGILARRWGTASAALRISDSAADYLFYLSVLYVVVLRHWPVVHARLWLLGMVLCLEAGRMLFDWMKYGKMASYHSYAAKAWGILLAMAVIAVLCLDRSEWLVTCALLWGILCNLESLAMSLLLPEWTHDVKTLGSAVRLRRAMLAKRELQVR